MKGGEKFKDKAVKKVKERQWNGQGKAVERSRKGNAAKERQ